MRKLGKTCAVVLLACLIPQRYLASPDWKVKVCDVSGKPLQNVTVRLNFQNYSVEDTSHEEDQLTDANGYVHFPEHRRWTMSAIRAFYTLKAAQALAHASFGPHASVFAFRDGLEGDVVTLGYIYDWTGQPSHVESSITLKPTN
ncbi:MAG TPA: hypothetical protein VFU50_14270 [Terriglobales bacterium]|nr:hypothetical protein [Terriglobales bacterium]